MKKYIRTATTTAEKFRVETPYNCYEFDTEQEAQEFEDFVNSDPDYDDPETGPIVEHCYFLNRDWE